MNAIEKGYATWTSKNMEVRGDGGWLTGSSVLPVSMLTHSLGFHTSTDYYPGGHFENEVIFRNNRYVVFRPDEYWPQIKIEFPYGPVEI